MPAVDGAVREIDSLPVPEAASPSTSSVPTGVSEVVIVASVERYQRSVVAAEPPAPALRTVADSVNVPPVAGPASDTVGVPTSRSGTGSDTSTRTDDEQLSVASDSSVTASTHAP